MRIITANKEREKFRDKTQMQLDQVKGQASYTRSRVRIRFPDNFVLEGSFGGRETVKDIYSYVAANLVETDKTFYLYETPPKRVLNDQNKSLFKSKFLPSCLLYFAWSEGESTAEHGPYLDLSKLMPFITAY